MAEDPAFQAGDAGSIPAWCSNWIGVAAPVVSEGLLVNFREESRRGDVENVLPKCRRRHGCSVSSRAGSESPRELCGSHFGVVQWQNAWLLTRMSQVRSLPPEP